MLKKTPSSIHLKVVSWQNPPSLMQEYCPKEFSKAFSNTINCSPMEYNNFTTIIHGFFREDIDPTSVISDIIQLILSYYYRPYDTLKCTNYHKGFFKGTRLIDLDTSDDEKTDQWTLQFKKRKPSSMAHICCKIGISGIWAWECCNVINKPRNNNTRPRIKGHTINK